MEERTRKLHRDYRVYVHAQTLRQFYKKNRVSFTKPQPSYRQDMENSDRLMPLRFAYAQKLASLVYLGAPIIYLDETSVNIWMRKTRCWQPKDSAI